MDEVSQAPAKHTRRDVLRTVGLAVPLAAAGLGIEGILAARRAPAYPPGTSLHFLLWKNFSPPADVEMLRQAADWGKQNNVNVRVEQMHLAHGLEPGGPG